MRSNTLSFQSSRLWPVMQTRPSDTRKRERNERLTLELEHLKEPGNIYPAMLKDPPP